METLRHPFPPAMQDFKKAYDYATEIVRGDQYLAVDRAMNDLFSAYWTITSKEMAEQTSEGIYKKALAIFNDDMCTLSFLLRNLWTLKRIQGIGGKALDWANKIDQELDKDAPAVPIAVTRLYEVINGPTTPEQDAVIKTMHKDFPELHSALQAVLGMVR